MDLAVSCSHEDILDLAVTSSHEDSMDLAVSCSHEDYEGVRRYLKKGTQMTSFHINAAFLSDSSIEFIDFLLRNMDGDLKESVELAIIAHNHDFLFSLLNPFTLFQMGRKISGDDFFPFHSALEMGRICCAEIFLEMRGKELWRGVNESGKYAHSIALEFCLNSENSGTKKFDMLVFCRKYGFTALFLNTVTQDKIEFNESITSNDINKNTMITFLNGFFYNSNNAKKYNSLSFL